MSIPEVTTRIVDRGYQHYSGVRLGTGHAFWTMFRASLLRSMGFRRKLGPSTVIKWMLAIIPYIPVVIAIVALANLPSAQTPPYARLFEGLELIYVLFAALIAPDMLCPDRHERVLSLYFAAPTSRAQYIAAQCLGLGVLLLMLTVAPMIVLFCGHALLSNSTARFVSDQAADLGHVLLGGSLLAAYYGVLAMAVASFSDRRAYAAGAFVGLLLVSSAAAAIVSRALRFSGHQWFALLDLLSMPVRTARWILGDTPEQVTSGAAYTPLANGWDYLAASAGVMAISIVLLVRNYLRVKD